MRTQREIFKAIANAIIDILPKDQHFDYVILEIKRLSFNVGYTGYYIMQDKKKKWLNIFDFNLDLSFIEDLYTITQTLPPTHKNWNRARYTLYPDAKFEIEYIWDQELQDEVDKLNSGH